MRGTTSSATTGVLWQRATRPRRCVTISVIKTSLARGGNCGYTWPKLKWFVTLKNVSAIPIFFAVLILLRSYICVFYILRRCYKYSKINTNLVKLKLLRIVQDPPGKLYEIPGHPRSSSNQLFVYASMLTSSS